MRAIGVLESEVINVRKLKKRNSMKYCGRERAIRAWRTVTEEYQPGGVAAREILA
jgi:hypothetical protein